MKECIQALVNSGYDVDEASSMCMEVYVNLGMFNLILFVQDVLCHDGGEHVDKV